MNFMNFDDLKFKMANKEIDGDISKLKDEINENLDKYFIDENEQVYKTMMKDYTGGKHEVYQDTSKTDFKKYNEYKNEFLNKFNKY